MTPEDEAIAPGTARGDAPQILPVGRDGVLMRFSLTATADATARVQAVNDLLRRAPLPGVLSFQPGLASILLRFDPGETDRARLIERLAEILHESGDAAPAPAARTWRIPAAFGGAHGPDLEATAALAGLSTQAAVEQVLSTPLRVLAIGFAPGQPYLGLLPEPWSLPRLETITPQVPRGTLAVAVRQMVLFANASPTGWRSLARTAFCPFQPMKDNPAPLRAGDEVTLVRASADELEALLRAGDPMGGATCRQGA